MNSKLASYKFITIVLVLSGFIRANASDIIILKSWLEAYIGQNISIFSDSANQYKINDIIKDSFQSRFQSNTEKSVYLPFGEQNHWLKFTLKSYHSHPEDYYIEFSNSTIDEIQMFYKHSDVLITTRETGDSKQFYTRQIKYKTFLYKVLLQPNEKYTFYVKVNAHGDALNIPVKIYTTNGITKKISINYLIYGIFYGILIALITASILMVLINIKFKTHLFYILYIFLMGFWNFNFDGLAFQYFYPSSPWITNHLTLMLPMAALISLSIFTIDYFELRKHFSRFYKLLMTVNAFTLILMLLTLFDILDFKINLYSLLLLGSLLILLITISAILSLKTVPLLSRLYLIAFVLLTLSTVMVSSSVVSGNIDSIFRDHALKTGFALQALILFTALFKKLKMQEEQSHVESIMHLKELNEFKEETNKNLEKKVEERTIELQQSNNQLVMANNEISEINAELEQQKEEISSIKDHIADQNVLLEERNKDITESISYASHIQQSVLPSQSEIEQCIPNSFILLKPKESLSGDFYWIKEISEKIHLGIPENILPDKVIFAAIDCTGHGVPGELLSIIGNNILNNIVEKKKIYSPKEILKALNQKICETLIDHSEKFTGKDGMDVSMIFMDNIENKIIFAGAKNPLYLIRNNELIIFKGSSFSIGNSADISKVIIEEYTIDIKKGDIFYMFSDGYADQIGGTEGKKLKYNRFRNLLLDIHQLPLNVQKDKLETYIKDWQNPDSRNSYEQIDDILIVGFNI